jgi:hypothetical protein
MLIIVSVLKSEHSKHEYGTNHFKKVVPLETCLRTVQRPHERDGNRDVDDSREANSFNCHVLCGYQSPRLG